MPTSPTTTGLALLLSSLDPDAESAAEKYEILRLKINKVLCWKGCPESRSDELADDVLDRICQKLQGGEIINNLNSYAAGVVRFVFLEYTRKNIVDSVGDDLPEVPVAPDVSNFDDEDGRMTCLRTCLAKVVPAQADRDLIVRYYDSQPLEKNKTNRKALAASLGLTANALKVRACRLRARLEQCINECSHVTKVPFRDTTTQEAISEG
jgi:hypothetical protein